MGVYPISNVSQTRLTYNKTKALEDWSRIENKTRKIWVRNYHIPGEDISTEQPKWGE